jgi:uncharacterized protein DUF6879
VGAVPPFSELIAATTATAVHLEMRDAYTPSDPVYQDWLAGRPVPEHVAAGWHDLVAEHAARGVAFRRLRVVSEPLAPYIRFEYETTAANNVAAGERVRWLPRRRATGLLLPALDFWLFDGRMARFHHFDGVGEIVDDEIVDDPTIVELCAMAFDAAWHRGVDHQDYRPA